MIRLDAVAAHEVVSSLRRLAHRRGKTIIATVHQPAIETFQLFDNAIVLAKGGRLAYFGPVSYLAEYCGAILRSPVPQYVNPADHILRLVSPRGDPQEVKKASDKIVVTYARKAGEVGLDWPPTKPTPGMDGLEDLVEGRTRPSISTRFFYLLQRSLRTQVRSKVLTRARIAQTILVGLIIGLVYLQLDRGASGGQNRLGLLFLTPFNIFMLALISIINSLPAERATAANEIADGRYSTISYFAAKSLADIPFQVLYALIFSPIVYWMTGLDADATKFVLFTFVLILMSIAGASTGFFIAAAAGTTELALAVAPATIVPFLIFAGVLVNAEEIPIPLRFLRYPNPGRWAFTGLAIQELEGMTFSCPDLPNGVCPIPTGDALLDIQSIDSDGGIGVSILVIVAFILVMRVLGGLAMVRAVRNLRKGS